MQSSSGSGPFVLLSDMRSLGMLPLNEEVAATPSAVQSSVSRG
jgi:hypothetical protein